MAAAVARAHWSVPGGFFTQVHQVVCVGDAVRAELLQLDRASLDWLVTREAPRLGPPAAADGEAQMKAAAAWDAFCIALLRSTL